MSKRRLRLHRSTPPPRRCIGPSQVPSPRCSRLAARGCVAVPVLPLPCANSPMPPSLRERGQIAAERHPTDGDPHGRLPHRMRPTQPGGPDRCVHTPSWRACPGGLRRLRADADERTRRAGDAVGVQAGLVQPLLRPGRAGHAWDGQLHEPRAEARRRTCPGRRRRACPLSGSCPRAADIPGV